MLDHSSSFLVQYLAVVIVCVKFCSLHPSKSFIVSVLAIVNYFCSIKGVFSEYANVFGVQLISLLFVN